ncbi:MAG: thermonuclease family protein [Peptococcaceae bacterium]|nr:thermonuclease family protein [Peptococcaceae bacterium]
MITRRSCYGGVNKRYAGILCLLLFINIFFSGCDLGVDAGGYIEGKVTRVIDGDTAYVLLNGGREEKVRFIGVDTPETNHPQIGEEPYGPEAKAYTKAKLEGRTVYLELDVEERDRYGRLLAYVWTDKPSGEGSEAEVRAKMFNAGLLINGYAQTLTVPPNVKYVDFFTQFQREAREAGRGLWGLEPPDQEVYYIGNSNSGKFHRPSCRSVKDIAPGHRVRLDTRDEALDQGYEPCRLCDP